MELVQNLVIWQTLVLAVLNLWAVTRETDLKVTGCEDGRWMEVA